MAARQQDSHYDAPSKNPPVGSAFEYFWHSFHILEDDLQLPSWWRPVPVPADSELAPMFQRANYELVLNEIGVEDVFVEKLLALGVPADKLERPFSGDAAWLIDKLVGAEAAHRYLQQGTSIGDQVLAVQAQISRRDLDLPAYRRELTVRVILAAQMFLKENQPTALCAFLNAGLPVDEDGREIEGLDRHAHRSVWRTFRKELKREGEARLDRLLVDVGRFDALQESRLQVRTSKKYPHLRSLKGAALAYAMHDCVDLRDAVFRIHDSQLRKMRQNRTALAV